MFKLVGIVLIMTSTIFISSQKVLECWFTYKFLDKTTEIIQKIIYEKNTNLPYGKIFEKLKFDYIDFLDKGKRNEYINKKETDFIKNFFCGLGRHDRSTENEYINTSIIQIKGRRDEYYNRYNQNKKIHILCGVSIGFFIVILLI